MLYFNKKEKLKMTNKGQGILEYLILIILAMVMISLCMMMKPQNMKQNSKEVLITSDEATYKLEPLF